MRTVLVGIGLLCALTACGQSVYSLNPTATQVPEHVAELATAPADDSALAESGSENVPPAYIHTYSRFRSALAAVTSEAGWSDAAAIRRYLETGITVADLYCKAHFDALTVAQARQNAARAQFSIVDAVIAGALGLGGAPVVAAAGSGLAFGLIDSTFENVEANFLASPDIPAVAKLVDEAQAALELRVLGAGMPRSYPAAERALSAYVDLCSFNGVKRLINESIAAGKPVLATSSSGQNELDRQAAFPYIVEISKAVFGSDSVVASNAQLAALYIYLVEGATGSPTDERIASLLGGTANRDRAKSNSGKIVTNLNVINRFVDLRMLSSQLKAEWVQRDSAVAQAKANATTAATSSTAATTALDGAGLDQAAVNTTTSSIESATAAVSGATTSVSDTTATSVAVIAESSQEVTAAAEMIATENETQGIVEAAEAAVDAAAAAAAASGSSEAADRASDAADLASKIGPDATPDDAANAALEVIENAADAIKAAAITPLEEPIAIEGNTEPASSLIVEILQ